MSDNLTFVSSKDFKKVVKDPESDSADRLVVRKQYVPEEIKQKGDSNSRIFDFVISTGVVDRDMDTVSTKGWDLKQYKKNPIVLFSHDSHRPPIGRGINIKLKDDKLRASVEFMDNDIDTTGFSDTIFRMVRGGFLRATSVGFIPKEFEFSDDEDRGADSFFGGIDFLKQELLEFSIVPVPSNPEALIEARSKGIDTTPLFKWFEEALDDWAEYKGMLLVPRKEIESLYKAITDNKSQSNVIFNLSKGEQAQLCSRNLEHLREQKNEEDLGENKQIVSTEDSVGHTHKFDNTKSGITGPASSGDEHSHPYEFGAEETAPGGDDMHKHGLSEFKSADQDIDDDDDVEDDSKPNAFPSGRDDGEQPNDHPMMIYGKVINQEGELLVDNGDGTYLMYTLDFLVSLQENNEVDLPENVTEKDIEWLTRINEKVEEKGIEEEKAGHADDDEDEDDDEEDDEKELDTSPIKLKIVTDGTTVGTKVLDSVSGRALDVESATLQIDVDSKKAMVQLVLTEALIELQQFASIQEEAVVIVSQVSKSEETGIKEYSTDEVVSALSPEEDTEDNTASEEISLTDDEILDVIKDVVPDMLRDIVKAEIGQMKGQLSK